MNPRPILVILAALVGFGVGLREALRPPAGSQLSSARARDPRDGRTLRTPGEASPGRRTTIPAKEEPVRSAPPDPGTTGPSGPNRPLPDRWEILVGWREAEPTQCAGAQAGILREALRAGVVTIADAGGLLASEDDPYRASLLLLMLEADLPPGADWMSLFRSIRDNPDPDVRCAAYLRFPYSHLPAGPDDDTWWSALADEPAPEARAAMLENAGRTARQSEREVRACLGATTDSDREVRIAALQALSDLEEPNADLRQGVRRAAASDPDEGVRREALRTMASWGR